MATLPPATRGGVDSAHAGPVDVTRTPSFSSSTNGTGYRPLSSLIRRSRLHTGRNADAGGSKGPAALSDRDRRVRRDKGLGGYELGDKKFPVATRAGLPTQFEQRRHRLVYVDCNIRWFRSLPISRGCFLERGGRRGGLWRGVKTSAMNRKQVRFHERRFPPPVGNRSGSVTLKGRVAVQPMAIQYYVVDRPTLFFAHLFWHDPTGIRLDGRLLEPRPNVRLGSGWFGTKQLIRYDSTAPFFSLREFCTYLVAFLPLFIKTSFRLITLFYDITFTTSNYSLTCRYSRVGVLYVLKIQSVQRKKPQHPTIYKHLITL